MGVREGTPPWAIFLFQMFLNYLSHKLEKIQITFSKSDNLSMNGNFRLHLYQYCYIKKAFSKKKLTFDPRQGPRFLPWAINLYICKH